MDTAELESIYRRGVRDRRAGVDYFANPYHESKLPLGEWFQVCTAWSAGWLMEDGGRTERIRQLQAMHPW